MPIAATAAPRCVKRRAGGRVPASRARVKWGMLTCRSRRREDGTETTWITPLFHQTLNADGTLRRMHILNYFQGPGYKVLFPFACQIGEHTIIPPFYFQGPGYKISPPLLSVWWRHRDGGETTWI